MSYPSPVSRPGAHDQYPYPPQGPNSYGYNNSNANLNIRNEESYKTTEDVRQISRTPSPTPSEAKELTTGALDWKQIMNWRFWIRREWLWYYVILTVILVLTGLMTIYHEQIVNWLQTPANWLHSLKFGFLVPIGILFVISFPPLFGHEIVAVLCGVVWGLWIGFAIVCAGTFLGEVGNFYAFKYWFRSRAEKAERSTIWYGCLARVIREGGFMIALIVRLSAVPGHFTTAVFATCGMNIFVFCLAAFLSLPKQFITVYLGVILEQSKKGGQDKQSKIISDVVLAITVFITFAAMWYILRKMNQAKPAVIYDRRKARQVKVQRDYENPYNTSTASSSATAVFNPRNSDSDIPLTSQQWDKEGNAVGFAGDPRLEVYAPQPLRGFTQDHGSPYSGSPSPSYGGRPGASSKPQRPMVETSRPSMDDVTWDMKPRYQPGSPGFASPSAHGPANVGRKHSQPYAFTAGQNAYSSRDNSPVQRQFSTGPTAAGSRSPPRIASPPSSNAARRTSYQQSPQQLHQPPPLTTSPGPINEVVQTPTQAQFVSYNPHPTAGGNPYRQQTPVSGGSPLPMPAFPASPTQSQAGSIAPPPSYRTMQDQHSQQQQQQRHLQQQQPYHHYQESTDASFRTAYETQ